MTTRNRIQDQDELLHRQVHPNFMRDGRPSSQAFRPTPKDNAQLSVDRSSLATAEESYRLFTEKMSLKSAGTWGVTVAECSNVGLPAYDDPISESPSTVENRAHAVISFAEIGSKSQVEAKGLKLARCAQERGRLYPPASTESDPE